MPDSKSHDDNSSEGAFDFAQLERVLHGSIAIMKRKRHELIRERRKPERERQR